MMISKKMEKALNAQMNRELFSWYLYLAMSAWFKDQNLDGFSNWMAKQAGEEMAHARKFYDYIFEVRGKGELDAIEKPKAEWDSPLNAFKEAFDHEQYITKNIHELVHLAREEKDLATESFLGWFVDEQVEEESTVDDIVNKLEMMKDFKGGLYMMDKELGAREA